MGIGAIVGIVGLVFIAAVLVFGGSDAKDYEDAKCDDDIREMLKAGQKVTAIKAYRYLHGTGLKESKEAVEKMIEGD